MSQMPVTVELCPRCRRHVVFNDWCYGCGFKGQGVVYVLVLAPPAVPPGDKE